MLDAILRLFIPNRAQDRDPGPRERCGVLAGGVGLGLNILLFVVKLCAGAITGAISVTADAFNNLSDAAGSAVTLAGFKLASQRADQRHPFGHGRAEYIAGLIVSLLILLVGFELGQSSVEKIIHPNEVTFSILAAIVLCVSIAIKLWMWRFNAALGRALQSQALLATATDALADSVATTAVLAGTVLGHFTRLPLDGWLGLAVAVFIVVSGFQAVRDTLDPLLGRPASPELVEEITRLVMEQDEVTGIHELVVHEYGPGHLFATIHAEVPADMTLLTAHAAADRAERMLLDRLGVQAVIHIDPENGDCPDL